MIAVGNHHQVGVKETGQVPGMFGTNNIAICDQNQCRDVDSLNVLWSQTSRRSGLLC